MSLFIYKTTPRTILLSQNFMVFSKLRDFAYINGRAIPLLSLGLIRFRFLFRYSFISSYFDRVTNEHRQTKTRLDII